MRKGGCDRQAFRRQRNVSTGLQKAVHASPERVHLAKSEKKKGYLAPVESGSAQTSTPFDGSGIVRYPRRREESHEQKSSDGFQLERGG